MCEADIIKLGAKRKVNLLLKQNKHLKEIDPMSLVPISYPQSKKCTRAIDTPLSTEPRKSPAYQKRLKSDKQIQEHKRFQSLPLGVKDMITKMALKDRNSLTRDEIISAALNKRPLTFTSLPNDVQIERKPKKKLKINLGVRKSAAIKHGFNNKYKETPFEPIKQSV